MFVRSFVFSSGQILFICFHDISWTAWTIFIHQRKNGSIRFTDETKTIR